MRHLKLIFTWWKNCVGLSTQIMVDMLSSFILSIIRIMNLWAGKIGSILKKEMLTIGLWKEKPFLKKRENTTCSLVYHDHYIEILISCDENDLEIFSLQLSLVWKVVQPKIKVLRNSWCTNRTSTNSFKQLRKYKSTNSCYRAGDVCEYWWWNHGLLYKMSKAMRLTKIWRWEGYITSKNSNWCNIFISGI